MTFYTTDRNAINFIAANATKDLTITKIGEMYFVNGEEIRELARAYVACCEDDLKRVENVMEKIRIAETWL